jgi:hypothetical protein
MPLLFAIIAELLSTIVSNVAIFLAAITLNIAHIPASTSSLGSKGNCSWVVLL